MQLLLATRNAAKTASLLPHQRLSSHDGTFVRRDSSFSLLRLHVPVHTSHDQHNQPLEVLGMCGIFGIYPPQPSNSDHQDICISSREYLKYYTPFICHRLLLARGHTQGKSSDR